MLGFLSAIITDFLREREKRELRIMIALEISDRKFGELNLSNWWTLDREREEEMKKNEEIKFLFFKAYH